MYPSWQMVFLIWGQIRERAEVSWGFDPFHMRQFGIPSPYYKRLRSKPSNNMSSPFSAIENLFQCYSFLGISVRKTENPRFAVLWTAGGTIFDSQSEEDRFRVISETRYLLYQYFFFRVVWLSSRKLHLLQPVRSFSPRRPLFPFIRKWKEGSAFGPFVLK